MQAPSVDGAQLGRLATYLKRRPIWTIDWLVHQAVTLNARLNGSHPRSDRFPGGSVTSELG
jgi:hypothetical protein